MYGSYGFKPKNITRPEGENERKEKINAYF
jgi:hypothetical protein